MADIIQADYERLEEIASRFGLRAEATAQTSAQVEQAMGSLQGGGWIGQGAEAFYAEMEGIVSPGMQRLADALEQARSVTLQIRDIVKEAEEEASAPFRGAHSGAGAGGTAGGAGVATPGGGSPGAAGPGGGGAGPTSGSGVGSAVGGGSAGGVGEWVADRPMVGFRLFGIGMGTQGLIKLINTGKAVAGPMHAVPVAGGIIGTALNIMDANARGENMDYAVGREIARGTLKTEVYLVPGLNVVAGGLEVANMFGVTKRNYTDVVVNAVADPVHKYALDPASDAISDLMVEYLPPWPW